MKVFLKILLVVFTLSSTTAFAKHLGAACPGKMGMFSKTNAGDDASISSYANKSRQHPISNQEFESRR